MVAQKIATCCYCGTRAALVIDRTRHELACSSCGAPLHDLKMLPKHHPGPRELVKPTGLRDKAKPKLKKTKKKKKRKSLSSKIFEEVFDVIEDIFD